jgi:hypothetical protein
VVRMEGFEGGEVEDFGERGFEDDLLEDFERG